MRAVVLFLAACATGGGGGGGTGPADTGWIDSGGAGDSGDSADPGDDAPCSALANLEIVPLDPWGRDLAVTLAADHDPTAVPLVDAGPSVVAWRYGASPVEVAVRLSAVDHEDLAFVAAYDGEGGFTFTGPAAGRLATSLDVRTVEGAECPFTTVYAGLDHAWFAATGPAPSKNRVQLYMDGAEQWADVAELLDATTRRLTWSTWWWESDFELVHPDGVDSRSEATRAADTLLGHFDALPGVEKRVLVNRFWGDNADWTEYLNTDAALLAAAETPGDAFEIVLQGNPTAVDLYGTYDGEAADYDFGERVLANPRYAARDVELHPVPKPVSLEVDAASWHQKAMVFDGTVAVVTGMNSKATDWDGNDHLVFDPRRMAFDATAADRQDVADEAALPDYVPRKDYGVRVEGPAVRDVESVLWERWEAARADGELYAENATPFALDPAPAEPVDGVPLQVVATLPEPWAAMQIGETHGRAFANARSYIYIEDQYFRAPLQLERIVASMDADPDLVLIVVTNDLATTDGGAKYTYLADAELRARYPGRYLLLQTASAELVTDDGWLWDTVEVEVQPIYLHSKLRLVDDRYLSVGSCNLNNRGYLYEGELDVAVLDTATATAARERVFANLAGPEWSALLSDDPQNNLDVLALAAAANAERLEWWANDGVDLDADEAEATWPGYRPSGFVYPLEIDDDYDWDVGPDAF